MASYPMPKDFDGAKFRARYSLGEFDFWDDGQGNLVIKDGIRLPDDPPIFEAPDPKVTPPTFDELVQRIEALEARVPVEV